PEGKRFCKCKPQLEGDKCKTIKDCDSGKYSECEKSGGVCEFDGTKTACKCTEGKKLDESLTKHICRVQFSDDPSVTWNKHQLFGQESELETFSRTPGMLELPGEKQQSSEK
ncbi:hypothetical protein AVEN_80204-1, partial [Araneus ventricosus]